MLKVQEIREIINLIDQSSIDEFKYETNGTKISLKKKNDNEPVNSFIKDTQVTKEKIVEDKPSKPNPEVKTVAKEEVDVKETEEVLDETNYDYEITSPMVGTFYQAPSPEDDPYVKAGDQVESETVVCIVEAMKLFNEIEAETTGEIVEILVEDGELVEYGQPLFRVKKT